MKYKELTNRARNLALDTELPYGVRSFLDDLVDILEEVDVLEKERDAAKAEAERLLAEVGLEREREEARKAERAGALQDAAEACDRLGKKIGGEFAQGWTLGVDSCIDAIQRLPGYPKEAEELYLLRGYVVSKGGTFGVVKRTYRAEDGEPNVLIQWGPQGWLTPARVADCKQLISGYESEAREEAEKWLAENERARALVGKYGA